MLTQDRAIQQELYRIQTATIITRPPHPNHTRRSKMAKVTEIMHNVRQTYEFQNFDIQYGPEFMNFCIFRICYKIGFGIDAACFSIINDVQDKREHFFRIDKTVR